MTAARSGSAYRHASKLRPGARGGSEDSFYAKNAAAAADSPSSARRGTLQPRVRGLGGDGQHERCRVPARPATLLPNGQVLAAGGDDNGIQTNNTSDIYDAASQKWTALANLPIGRLEHTATLLPNGKILVVGGNTNTEETSSELISYSEYNPPNASLQPTITTIAGTAATAAVTVTPGSSVTVSGTLFTGASEGSGGDAYQNSAANLPRVYLRPNDSGPTNASSSIVDLSTSVYLSSFSATNLTFILPSNTGPGYYNLWVQANAVPSAFASLQVSPSPPPVCTYPGGGANAFTFTNNPLVAGQNVVRAVHVSELQTDIASLRTDAGLSTWVWVDPTPSANKSVVRAVDINDLRNALIPVYSTCGQGAP